MRTPGFSFLTFVLLLGFFHCWNAGQSEEVTKDEAGIADQLGQPHLRKATVSADNLDSETKLDHAGKKDSDFSLAPRRSSQPVLPVPEYPTEAPHVDRSDTTKVGLGDKVTEEDAFMNDVLRPEVRVEADPGVEPVADLIADEPSSRESNELSPLTKSNAPADNTVAVTLQQSEVHLSTASTVAVATDVPALEIKPSSVDTVPQSQPGIHDFADSAPAGNVKEQTNSDHQDIASPAEDAYHSPNAGGGFCKQHATAQGLCNPLDMKAAAPLYSQHNSDNVESNDALPQQDAEKSKSAKLEGHEEIVNKSQSQEKQEAMKGKKLPGGEEIADDEAHIGKGSEPQATGIEEEKQAPKATEVNEVPPVVNVSEEMPNTQQELDKESPLIEHDGTSLADDALVKDVPTKPVPDPEDLPTFEEWKKKKEEEDALRSQEEQNTVVIERSNSNGVINGNNQHQTMQNYANVDCGAKVAAANSEAQSPGAVLDHNRDAYMLNPCSAKIWFVVELCDQVLLNSLEIANFELFSSRPRNFTVSTCARYPTREWNVLGEFQANDTRDVQSFSLEQRVYAKYVKVEVHSHHGEEHYCPISLVRILATSMVEEYELSEAGDDKASGDQEEDDDVFGGSAAEQSGLLIRAKAAVYGFLEALLGQNETSEDDEPLPGAPSVFKEDNSTEDNSTVNTSESGPRSTNESNASGTTASTEETVETRAVYVDASVTLAPKDASSNPAAVEQSVQPPEDISLQEAKADTEQTELLNDKLEKEEVADQLTAQVTPSETVPPASDEIDTVSASTSTGGEAAEVGEADIATFSSSHSETIALLPADSILKDTHSAELALENAVEQTVDVHERSALFELVTPTPTQVDPNPPQTDSVSAVNPSDADTSIELAENRSSDTDHNPTPLQNVSNSSGTASASNASTSTDYTNGQEAISAPSSGAPKLEKESVFIRLNKRIKALDLKLDTNLSSIKDYLGELRGSFNRFKKNMSELHRVNDNRLHQLNDSLEQVQALSQAIGNVHQQTQEDVANLAATVLVLTEELLDAQEKILLRQQTFIVFTLLMVVAALVVFIYLSTKQLSLLAEKQQCFLEQVLVQLHPSTVPNGHLPHANNLLNFQPLSNDRWDDLSSNPPCSRGEEFNDASVNIPKRNGGLHSSNNPRSPPSHRTRRHKT